MTLATRDAGLSRMRPKWPAKLETESFLGDRQTRGLSERTPEFYQDELQTWSDWLSEQGASELGDVMAPPLCRWLLHLGQRRSAGGVHANYRSIRAFLHWTWEENEIDTSNPISRVKPPKLPQELLEPVSPASLKALLDTCDGQSFTGCRDRALLLALTPAVVLPSSFPSISATSIWPMGE